MDQPVQPQPSQANDTNTKMLVWWRKNLYWGGATVPVVMEVVDGQVNLIDKSMSTVFSAPIQGLHLKSSWLRPLQFRTQGKKYDIIPIPAKISPDPSKEQIAYMNQPMSNEARNATTGQSISNAGLFGLNMPNAGDSAIGGAAEIVGSAMELAAYNKGSKSLKDVKSALAKLGAIVD